MSAAEQLTIEPVSAQLRRRRRASLRCEPLADGRRDPWSAKAAAGLQSLHLEVGKRTAWIFGEGVFGLLDAVGVERRQWDHTRRCWMVPVAYADDVAAWAEWRQRRIVTVEAVDR